MKIRLAEKTDIGHLVEFNQAMALETEGRRLDAATLADGVASVFADEKKGFYVVAENDGAIAGGLMVTYEWSDWRNGWFWWIQSVYVRPEFRGRRVYEGLYGFVREQAAGHGDVCGFRLYVETENTRAQSVYEKNGMRRSHYVMYESQK